MLHFLRFLFSRAFFWNLLLVLIAITALLLLTFYGLNWHTRQGGYAPFAVIEQTPLARELVKKNRKIYLTLNPANYNEVILPDVIQITRRSAESTLRAVGLEIGEILYQDNIGKDMVLQLRYDQAPIAPGDKLPKTSRVDLVLGNGKKPVE
jgi:beta-lactam-binding protein with PASTA domain